MATKTLLFSLSLMLAGCGGSSPESPFAGSYAGTWADYLGVTTFDMDVDRIGNSRWTLGSGRTAMGLIRSDGTTTLTIRYPRENATGSPFAGSLLYVGSPHGTITITFN